MHGSKRGWRRNPVGLLARPATSRFRDALVSLVPSDLDEAEPFPGSLLTQMSALASPEIFIWSRLTDAALSVANQSALEIHARVERWALDEVPLPGKFVHQLIEWLYREDRFCRGELRIDKLIGPQSPRCRSRVDRTRSSLDEARRVVGVSMREAGESFRQARPCLGLRVLTFGRPSRRSGLQKLEHKRCSQRRKGVVQSSPRISGSRNRWRPSLGFPDNDRRDRNPLLRNSKDGFSLGRVEVALSEANPPSVQ